MIFDRKNRNRRTTGIAALFICTMLFFAAHIPVSAFAATEAVAQIGETTYTDIDAAIEAATDGDTITLLKDVAPEKTFYKSLTFTGGHTLTYDVYGWNYSDNLTFDGADLVVNSDYNRVMANNSGTYSWLAIRLNGSITAKNGASITFSYNSASGTTTAIYLMKGTINVSDKSQFSVYGSNTAGKSGYGIQAESTAGTALNVIGESAFLIDGANRGYDNIPNIYVEDSCFTVRNCTNNGSNHGFFKAVNSTVNFTDNKSHGLSCDSLEIIGSTVTCNGNGYYGITVNTNTKISNSDYVTHIDGGSVVTANENGWGYTGGGIRFSGKTATNYIASGSTVTISGNHCNALENMGNTTFADGCVLKITNNDNTVDNGGGIYNGTTGVLYIPAAAVVMNNQAASKGGGIYNAGSITMADSVKLYNNHAVDPGDDLYQNEYGKIQLIKTGSDWTLDNTECNHAITGWFEDGNNDNGTRWCAHLSDTGSYYINEVSAGTITGYCALKAAHGMTTLSYEFSSGTDGKKLPEQVLTLIPSDENKYEVGAKVNAQKPSSEEVAVEGGKWVFDSYTPDPMQTGIDASKNKFTGTWKFIEDISTDTATPEQTETSPGEPDQAEQSEQSEQQAKSKANGVPENMLTLSAAEEFLTTMSKEEVAGLPQSLLQAKSVKQTQSSVQIKWKKLAGAVNYVIYASKCGKQNKLKKIATVKCSSFTAKKLNKKKLKKGTYYKFYVLAIDKDGNVLATSNTIHAATKGGKAGNPTKLTVKSKVKKSLTKMKVGKMIKLNVKQTEKGIVKKHRKIKYESSDPNVAAVSASGKVTAKGKGTAEITVYAQNGVTLQLKVKVK